MVAPPEQCPRCKRRNGEVQGRSWVPYRKIAGAPAVGCGACGYVIYLDYPERHK